MTENEAEPRRISTTLRYRADVKEIIKRRAKDTGRSMTNYIEALVLRDDGRMAEDDAPPAKRTRRARA